MGARATLVRLGLLAVDEAATAAPRMSGPARPEPPRVPDTATGTAPDTATTSRAAAARVSPLTAQRLRLRADLAYALAAVDGRQRVGDADLATADRLAVRLLDRWSDPAASLHHVGR